MVTVLQACMCLPLGLVLSCTITSEDPDTPLPAAPDKRLSGLQPIKQMKTDRVLHRYSRFSQTFLFQSLLDGINPATCWSNEVTWLAPLLSFERPGRLALSVKLTPPQLVLFPLPQASYRCAPDMFCLHLCSIFLNDLWVSSSLLTVFFWLLDFLPRAHRQERATCSTSFPD